MDLLIQNGRVIDPSQGIDELAGEVVNYLKSKGLLG